MLKNNNIGLIEIKNTENIKIESDFLNKNQVFLTVKREDLIHKYISGNKFRKLKYNIIEAKKQHKQTLLSFGGAYSNHIEALSFAGHELGMNTIGLIRGDELSGQPLNPTLTRAFRNGMKLVFITRKQYSRKEEKVFLMELKNDFGDFYLIPEGGTNHLAVLGCEEIIGHQEHEFDVIASSVGTGGTISGIINASSCSQKVIGFSALKGDFLKDYIVDKVNKDNWELNEEYHFGGYAKVTNELIDFINNFKMETGIPLDPIYTGKMMFGIYDLIKKGKFQKNTSILAIHTGGLQGIDGMNQVLQKKGMKLIV